MKKKLICAVVVTFQPNLIKFVHNLNELKKQVHHVFVVDNTPESNTISKDIERVTISENVTLIQNKKNLGIAKALNQGISLGINKDYTYLITFDQDSCPEKGMVENLLNFYQKSKNKFILVTPQSVDKFETTKHLNLPIVVDKAITSGMMLSSDIIQKCGMMKEKMFIDYVDFEFCLRFRKMGGLIYSIPGPKLMHSLGELSEFKMLGKTYWPTNHSSFRRYFITRNRIYVWKRYTLDFPRWVLRDIKFFLIETFLIIIAEKHKSKKIFAILNGFLNSVTF
jgi:rhamnosyltransferase